MVGREHSRSHFRITVQSKAGSSPNGLCDMGKVFLKADLLPSPVNADTIHCQCQPPRLLCHSELRRDLSLPGVAPGPLLWARTSASSSRRGHSLLESCVRVSWREGSFRMKGQSAPPPTLIQNKGRERALPDSTFFSLLRCCPNFPSGEQLWEPGGVVCQILLAVRHWPWYLPAFQPIQFWLSPALGKNL